MKVSFRRNLKVDVYSGSRTILFPGEMMEGFLQLVQLLTLAVPSDMVVDDATIFKYILYYY